MECVNMKARFSSKLNSLALGAGAVALALGSIAVPASAQSRDPAYAAARASGQIGEKVDGYLGFPGTASSQLRAVVDDINIKRKAIYAQKAQSNNATVEEYAFTSGCLAIARTAPGEKYQAPDGSWQTRGAGAPIRDSRCP